MRRAFALIPALVQLSLFFLLAISAEAVEVSIMPTFDAQLLPGDAFPLGDGEETLFIDGGDTDIGAPIQDILAEFPLDQIPPGAIISSAQLMLDATGNSASIVIEVLGYEGDGLASLSDEDINTTLIGMSSGPLNNVSDISIDLNSTLFESLLGSTHVGLRLASATEGPFINIAASESAGVAPTLLVEYSIVGGEMNGDMNADGFVDVDDVGLFVLALTNRAAYDALGYGVDADIVGNVNGDGQFDLGDLGDFSALLGGPASASASAVPEPGALVLMAWGWLGLCLRSKRRRGYGQA